MQQEAGLARQLSSGQLAMIAIGGAIGTGLFLGSSLAVQQAGPAVIVTYFMGAVIAWLLMNALSEMAVAHPTAGSFGVYAELYVSRWAGFAVRFTYWAVQAIAIGGEATAAGIYCRWWFPQIPMWIWVAAFSLALLYVNARSVGSFGTFEYWFSMIKVVAIMLFVVFGAAALMGVGHGPAIGLRNYTVGGGFFPYGWKGAWLALVFVIYSYIGTEIVAVTAGEAKDPVRAVPRAMRTMVGRLILFYVGSIVVLIGVVPWNQMQSGDVTASPFVRVFQLMGIPAAAHLINFVVLTAALSSINCNLYLCARMMFSLARAGHAPERFGRLSRKETPVNALLVSAFGLAIATVVALVYPSSAYVYMFGVALFGGLFVWLMIFLTHLFFRAQWERSGNPRLPVRMPGYPWTSLTGVVAVAAITLSTWWVPGMRITLITGPLWLAFLSLLYLAGARRALSATEAEEAASAD